MANNSPRRYSSSHGMVFLRNIPEFWFVQVELDPAVEHRFCEYEDAVNQGKAILTRRDNRDSPGVFAVEYTIKNRGELFDGQYAGADAQEILLEEIDKARLESQRLPHTKPALHPR
ncbi:hypothetical protein BDV38DRAFT_281585 [Aspergillus pseudotamarii]|uniref:Uncharacterized protein n=1 Tax=Aspergillus pseudotamarii TaxID=132259 RepID=A0A5N6T0H2_ASPPS|nr:uncharacterized protein BDV38DRAFT_281585 [Aspergillus pseudotamarii]KAE8139024.1 hypothetical protein BDV38DRAFT_281585 [Aspergillus pseudotamarii]